MNYYTDLQFMQIQSPNTKYGARISFKVHKQAPIPQIVANITEIKESKRDCSYFDIGEYHVSIFGNDTEVTLMLLFDKSYDVEHLLHLFKSLKSVLRKAISKSFTDRNPQQ